MAPPRPEGSRISPTRKDAHVQFKEELKSLERLTHKKVMDGVVNTYFESIAASAASANLDVDDVDEQARDEAVADNASSDNSREGAEEVPDDLSLTGDKPSMYQDALRNWMPAAVAQNPEELASLLKKALSSAVYGDDAGAETKEEGPMIRCALNKPRVAFVDEARDEAAAAKSEGPEDAAEKESSPPLSNAAKVEELLQLRNKLAEYEVVLRSSDASSASSASTLTHSTVSSYDTPKLMDELEYWLPGFVENGKFKFADGPEDLSLPEIEEESNTDSNTLTLTPNATLELTNNETLAEQAARLRSEIEAELLAEIKAEIRAELRAKLLNEHVGKAGLDEGQEPTRIVHTATVITESHEPNNSDGEFGIECEFEQPKIDQEKDNDETPVVAKDTGKTVGKTVVAEDNASASATVDVDVEQVRDEAIAAPVPAGNSSSAKKSEDDASREDAEEVSNDKEPYTSYQDALRNWIPEAALSQNPEELTSLLKKALSSAVYGDDAGAETKNEGETPAVAAQEQEPQQKQQEEAPTDDDNNGDINVEDDVDDEDVDVKNAEEQMMPPLPGTSTTTTPNTTANANTNTSTAMVETPVSAPATDSADDGINIEEEQEEEAEIDPNEEKEEIKREDQEGDHLLPECNGQFAEGQFEKHWQQYWSVSTSHVESLGRMWDESASIPSCSRLECKPDLDDIHVWALTACDGVNLFIGRWGQEEKKSDKEEVKVVTIGVKEWTSPMKKEEEGKAMDAKRGSRRKLNPNSSKAVSSSILKLKKTFGRKKKSNPILNVEDPKGN